MISAAQHAKAEAFRRLHEGDDILLLPNPWNAGSAKLLAAEGFRALGTTSAGIAFSLGLPDPGPMERDVMLAEVAHIAGAVDLPVSADIESGYGPEPEHVAETVRRTIAAGAVGGNLEDATNRAEAPLYEPAEAADRIRAARAAADVSGMTFTVNARTDPYLTGHPEPFAEAVRRANLYREAGADCLFVPGALDAEAIGALVREIDGPLNVVMGLAGGVLSVAELRDLGVRRISLGGSLCRATFGLLRRAARQMLDAGSFAYAADAIPHAEMDALFEG